MAATAGNSGRIDRDSNTGGLIWPAEGWSRVPFDLFCDPGIHELEDERLFRGPHWSYLGLEVEVPEPGDYTTGYVGATPVVLVRDEGGALRAFVNRCAHRGAEVVRRPRGNARGFTCIYHNWSYDRAGRVVGVPWERGRGGVGGYDPAFDKAQHRMRPLRVASRAGVVFGTFSDDAPPLDDYLGPAIRERLSAVFARPVMVTGYQRHTIRANWKLLYENSRDFYHAPQLHKFFGAFGIVQPDQAARAEMWHEGTHCLLTIYRNPDARNRRTKLEEPRVAAFRTALPENIAISIVGIFPNCLFTLIGSAFSIRQFRPKAPDRFEVVYTYFTYADDPECLREHLFQNNQFGPAGYVAMEDAEVVEKLQARIALGADKGAALVAMDGTDTTPGRIDHMVTEANLRAMWKGYARFMGFAPPDGGRPGAAQEQAQR